MSIKSNLLIEIISELEPLGMAILHGYETYPESIPSDVDIIGTTLVNQKIIEWCKSDKYNIVQFIQHEKTCYYWVFCLQLDNCRPEFLQIDFAADYRRNGRIFYQANEMLSKKQVFKRLFPTLTPHMEFAYYLTKKITKKSIDNTQTNYLFNLFNKDTYNCSKEIEQILPKKEAEKLIEAIHLNNQEYIKNNIKALNKSILSKNLNNSPRSTVLFYIDEAKRIIYRITNPTGLVIAFLGLDGSGKSSVIDNINSDLLGIFRQVKYIHLRPSLRKKPYDNTDRPHDKKKRNGLASTIKLLYWLLEYSIGWLSVVYPEKVRSSLVIFDRYYEDLLVDPLRYRYGGSAWLSQFISKLLPKPDLYIILDLPAEMANSRKAEIDLNDARKIREQYLSLASELKNSAIINAGNPLEDVINDVESLIISHMKNRTKSRASKL